ncbi:MAG: proton-conducting transporter membrane subunit [Cyclobacteriaceae bacterium]
MNLEDQLTEIINNLQFLKVESTLMLGAILLLVGGMITKSGILIKSVYAGVILLAFYFNWQGLAVGSTLSESLFLTSTSQHFTAIFLLSSLIILLYKRADEHATEFYFLILSLIVGSLFIMKANSFLVTYLAVELTSFGAYILTNFSFKKKAHEAGIKYLLFGALSSAIMLFGFGLIYGISGSFYLSELGSFDLELVGNAGILMMLFGLFFKASIVPLHVWVPATYQEAPNDATAILSIVPKLGALVLIQRIYSIVQSEWILNLCLILGMLTILSGVLSALRQSGARRMISFGAIAHSGFLFPFALILSETSIQAFWWYAVAYAIMNVAVFYFLEEFESRGLDRLEDFSGLGDNNPIMFVSVTVLLISLIGLPPVAGFTAKFFLFTTLWEQYQSDGQLIFIACLVVAVFATVISLFFYLRIPYYLFLVKEQTSRSIEFSFWTKFIATLFSIVLLLLFFVPQILTVMQQLLKSTP